MASSRPQAVVVASQNAPKIKATQEGFSRMLTGPFDFRGISVASGVPDQPLSDQETLLGAQNRCQNAQEAVPDADYWVGIEGGVQEQAGVFQSFAWIFVTGRDGRIGKARTSAYCLSEETAKLLREGKELGDADDHLFGRSNTKQGLGSVGLLTDGVVDRADYYTQAVVLALIPFKNTNLTFK